MPLLYEQPAPVDASSAPRLAIREASQSIRGRGLSAEPIAQTLDQIQDAFSGLMSQLTRVASGRFDELIVTSSGTGEVVGWVGSHDQYQGGWFRNLYIGGTDPTTSPLVADENGRVTLTLGSGTDQGFLAVLDGTGTQVLWAGKTGSNYGLWAKNVWIGGSGPSTAVFWSDGTQTVIGKNGYIAFQNASGVENGWIGARTISAVPYAGGWVKEWRIGGTSAPTAQLVADSSGNVTITNGSFSITSGTTTINIDATNKVKVSDSLTVVTAIHDSLGFTVSSALGLSGYLGPNGWDLQSIGVSRLKASGLNYKATAAPITLSPSIFAIFYIDGVPYKFPGYV